MKVSKELDNIPLTNTITVGQYKIKKVKQFKYLVIIVTIIAQTNECQIKIQKRIKMRTKCVYVLHNLLSSRILSKNAKIQLYMTIIRSIVMYWSQCWPLRKIEEDRLRIFVRKVL